MRSAMALALPSSLAFFLALGACSQGRPDSDALPTHDAAGHDTAGHDTASHDTTTHDTTTHDTATHDTTGHDTTTHDTTTHDTTGHDTTTRDSGPSCNNGKREGTEACDKADLDGKTCKSLGFVSGPLTCKSDCTFDKSACVLATGKVVISELMVDPLAIHDDKGEWIELFNTENQPIDLKGWTVLDEDSDNHTITAHVII
ncbi:MAG: lamin tail domain-containing protein, partial [Deltaproteobacteria bacterium]|nr:lamin tail domain-containing protein [Deltaproteobacteria bacterium]